MERIYQPRSKTYEAGSSGKRGLHQSWGQAYPTDSENHLTFFLHPRADFVLFSAENVQGSHSVQRLPLHLNHPLQRVGVSPPTTGLPVWNPGSGPYNVLAESRTPFKDVFECFACMYVRISHAYLIPLEAREDIRSLGTKLMGSFEPPCRYKSQTCVLCKNSKCT